MEFAPHLLSQGSVIDLDGTLFIQLGLFLASFFVLKTLVFKQALGVFDLRVRATEGAEQDAQSFSELAAEHARSYESSLDEAHAQGAQQRRARLEIAREEATQLRTRSEREVATRIASVEAALASSEAEARSRLEASQESLLQAIKGRLLEEGKSRAA